MNGALRLVVHSRGENRGIVRPQSQLLALVSVESSLMRCSSLYCGRVIVQLLHVLDFDVGQSLICVANLPHLLSLQCLVGMVVGMGQVGGRSFR